MARSRSHDLYSSLYLFFARKLAGLESSTIEFSERFPGGVWTTRVETGCGVYLHRPPLHPEPVYRKSPTNTVQFANTGGDGVFYGFLAPDGDWGDDSPVVVMFPASLLNDEPSWIAGGCLRDFLRLGRRVGFFALADLVIGAASGKRRAIRSLEATTYPDWIRPEQAAQLDRLAAKFRLKPLTDVAIRIAEWQRRYRPLVQHPAAKSMQVKR